MLAPLLISLSVCTWHWVVTMPSGDELQFTGERVENAFRIQDGYTDIWVYYKDDETGRQCIAPNHKWFFLSGFDYTGDASNWSFTFTN